MHPFRSRQRYAAAWLLGASLSVPAGQAWAIQPKAVESTLEAREFFLPELYLSSSNVPLADVREQSPQRAAWQRGEQRDALGQEVHVFIDPRSGAATSVLGVFPLIPGDGAGNSVSLGDLGRRLGRAVTELDAQSVAEAAHAFVRAQRELLGIDAAQLGAVRAAQATPDLWHVSIPQVVDGVRVRDARVALTISHGNVVLFGTEAWGDASLSVKPEVSAEQAKAAGFEYAGGRSSSDRLIGEPQLEVVPVAPQEHQAGEAFAGPLGRGYRHRLVWTFRFQRAPEQATWEPMVDAHTGEVIAFQDTNHYVAKQFSGGVYPVTGTGVCPNNQTCGTMQPGWPMPFANTGLAAPNNFTNSAGLFNYTSGTVTTTLAGQYVRMSDACGAISASSATGDINLGGTNNQHDCATPGTGGAGNTPASRSGFYELNKLVEQAKGWLPGNAWLNAQLTSNMNIALTCNAFWSPSAGTVNFYRSGGGCRNTGEIAAVFDHEWGHGMDDNDTAGALSNSSEGYADIAAIYRLQASCVGFGFFDTSVAGSCGLTADGTGRNQNENQVGGLHCDLDCSGVRDADWARHNPATPDTALGFVCNECGTGTGPCGRQVHCAAAPSRQAAWDLVTRDLTAAPFSLDSQSAFLVGNKVFYQGSGNIGAWHACTCGTGGSSNGCGATNAYMLWLAADDDNGNVNDGTPHMTALFNAFNRHGIACATPAAVNSGCAGGPTTAPTLTATPGDNSASLSWNAVAGASRYWVLRTEGHAGCDFGKAKIAEVTGTTYTDAQVANGRLYSYNVVAQGTSASCYTRVSNCAQVTPAVVTTPNFTISCTPASLTLQRGGSATSTCTVTSSGGFNSAVTLSCAGLPAGVTCTPSPNPVTPPANGSVSSTITYSASTTATLGSATTSVSGTGGGLTRSANVTLNVTQPDFSIACSPASVTLPTGQSRSTTCSVTSTGGFSSAVTLSCAGLPAGVSCAISPNPVTPPANGSVSSTVTYSATTAATLGTFTTSVSGSGGGLTRSTNVTLTVNNQLSVSITSDYTVATCTATGGTPGYTYFWYVTPITCPDPCPTCPCPLTATGEADVCCIAAREGRELPAPCPIRAPRPQSICPEDGPYTSNPANQWFWNGSEESIRCTATDAVGATVSSPSITRPPQPADFSISCSPVNLTLPRGGSATSTCTVFSSGGFNSAVTLSCASLPAGVTCAPSPNPVTPPANGSASSVITYTASTAATLGSATTSVSGTGGGLTRSANVTLNVTQPDFSIACSPSSLVLPRNQSRSTTCTVTSAAGFSSAVTLSCGSLPAGVSCSASPNPVTPPANGSASSTVTYTATASATLGTFTTSVSGSGGGLTRSTNVTLTVNDQLSVSITSDYTVATCTATGGTPGYTYFWYVTPLSCPPPDPCALTATGETDVCCVAAREGRELPLPCPIRAPRPQSICPEEGPYASSPANQWFWNGTEASIRCTATDAVGTTASSISIARPVPPADFALSCSPTSLTASPGGATTTTCTVTSLNAFTSSVSLSCGSLPAGVSCSASPNPVTPPANGSASSSVTFSVAASTAVGAYSVLVNGVGGGLTRSASVTLNVANAPLSATITVAGFTATCNASGGTPPYTYRWYVRYLCDPCLLQNKQREALGEPALPCPLTPDNTEVICPWEGPYTSSPANQWQLFGDETGVRCNVIDAVGASVTVTQLL